MFDETQGILTVFSNFTDFFGELSHFYQLSTEVIGLENAQIGFSGSFLLPAKTFEIRLLAPPLNKISYRYIIGLPNPDLSLKDYFDS